MNPKVLIATRNVGKQREIRDLLRDVPVRIVFPGDQGLYERPDEEAIENADSFEGNAGRKAEYFANLSRLPTAAEDSGLEVFALGGDPGVRSKRFALPTADPTTQDAANNAELIRRLAGAPRDRRRARYRCCIVYLEHPNAVPAVFDGTCSGYILESPSGSNGFGYDPLFYSDDLEAGFGDTTPEDKAQVSHRGRAFRAFAEHLVGSGKPSDP